MDTGRAGKGTHSNSKDGGKAKEEEEEEEVVQRNNHIELPLDNNPRIRWTKELHEIFVEAIGRLGGILRATPSKIVREMSVEGLTVRHVKSHLQKYRRQQEHAAARKVITKGVATQRREALRIHAAGYGRSSNQTGVGTIQPVIPMQTATNLGGQFVEPVIIHSIGTQNWNSTIMPTSTDRRSSSNNPTTPQNQMQRWLVHGEVPMHILSPPAAEEHKYNPLKNVEESTRMIAPTHGSTCAAGLQIDEIFLDLDEWPY